MHLADMTMEIYAMDSAICRAEKYPTEVHVLMAGTFVSDALERVRWSATQILAALFDGDTLTTHLGRLHALCAYTPTNTVNSRRRIAEYLLENDDWR